MHIFGFFGAFRGRHSDDHRGHRGWGWGDDDDYGYGYWGDDYGW